MSEQERALPEAAQMVVLAAGLRDLATMLDAHPEFSHLFRYTLMRVNVFVDGDEQGVAKMADLVRAGLREGAKVDKDASDDYMWAAVKFGPVELHVNVQRDEVCERVQVGEKTVTETIPDPSVTVPTVEVTKTVPVYEWQCTPLLASAGGES